MTRHIQLNLDIASDQKQLECIGRALSSQARIQMLALLKHRSMNIVELAAALAIPVSSAAFHVGALEKAELIRTELLPGIRGSQRVCSLQAEDIFLSLNTPDPANEPHSLTVDMPIGNYYDFEIHPTCGMIGAEAYIGSCDDTRSFYAPDRSNAQLIWFQSGFVEYRFPNHMVSGRQPHTLSFSLELCSEAPGYREVWPSDITFSLNGRELLTYTCPGDFGGRHGKLTPIWWTDGNTQFGLLKTISVDRAGVYLDGTRVSTAVTIEDLALEEKPFLSFTIAVKKDARHVGGINIFGKHCGDYPQDLIMQANF